MPAITFSGLSSGIDFDRVIDALLIQESVGLRAVERERQAAELRKTMVNEVQSALTALDRSVSALLTPASMKGSVATSADRAVVTAAASADAARGTYNVTVVQLATGTRLESGYVTQTPALLGLGTRADPAQVLSSADAKLRTAVTAGNFTINGTRITVDPTVDTLNAVVARITTATGVTASYDSNTDKVTLSSGSSLRLGAVDDSSNLLSALNLLATTEVESGGQFSRTSVTHLGAVKTGSVLAQGNFHTAVTGDANGDGRFKLNGIEITYNLNTDGLQDVINRINQKVASVQASYDAINDRLVLVSRTTGSLDLSREDVVGNFLDATGLLDSGSVARVARTSGQNAKVTVEGLNNNQPIVSTSNEVTGVISGVTLSLVKSQPGQSVAVTVAPDQEALRSGVQNLVNSFNAALSLITQRLTERPVAEPRNDAERRQGLLAGDPLLTRTKNDLVRQLTDAVSTLPADLRQALQAGLKLSSLNTGEIALNTTTLNQKLADNRDGVYRLLFDDLDSDGKVDAGEDGLAVRLQQKLTTLLSTDTQIIGGNSVPKGTLPQRQRLTDEEIARLDRRRDEHEARLAQTEQRLRLRFALLERQLASLRARAADFSSLGSLNEGR